MGIGKQLQNVAAIISALLVIGGFCWKAFELDSRSWTSMEDRANGEKIIEAIDPIQMAEQRIKDSIYQQDTKKSREEKAKTLDSIKEAIRYNDSINLLNAEQISILRTEMADRDSLILEAIKNVH